MQSNDAVGVSGLLASLGDVGRQYYCERMVAILNER